MHRSTLCLLALLVACGDKEDTGDTDTDTAVDADGDGADASVDCDDDDASINPDAAEACDGVDNNCDGAVDEGVTATFYADSDGDGYGSPDVSEDACAAPAGYVDNNEDCDDADGSTSPEGAEVCDGLDNDCDGDVDEDAKDAATYYIDADGDGYGDPAAERAACVVPSDGVTNSDDCDDTDAALSPETLWHTDADGDGYGDPDNTVAGCTQPSGATDDSTDCDDRSGDVYPGADEYCDSIDSDCDGTTSDGDELDFATFYADRDGDGYGDPDDTTDACDAPSGYIDNADDCDDADDATSPDALDRCDDGADNDCDGTADNRCAYIAEQDAGLTINGDGDEFGHRLSIGDLDGDGSSDLLITAISADINGTNTGTAYLYLGPLSSGADLDTSDADMTATGGDAYDYLGWSADITTDINNDGYNDLVLGAYGDDEGASSAGAAYVHYGPLSGGDLVEADLDVKVTGTASSDYGGRYIARGADVDSDGDDELIVGFNQDDTPATSAGSIGIYHAPADGDTLDDADTLIYGSGTSAAVGYSLEMVEDLDGDGYDELFYGEIGTEMAYLISGPITAASYDSADADVAFDDSAHSGSDGGSDLTSGDFNDDGYTDFWVAAREDDTGGSNAGALYLYYGTSTGLSGTIRSSSADATIYEDTASCYIGGVYGKLLTIDHDGDGTDDLLTSSFTNDSYVSDGGAGFLYYGPLSGSQTADDYGRAVFGENGEEVGRHIAYGDLDGDGAGDLLLSSVDANSTDGAVYFFFGF